MKKTKQITLLSFVLSMCSCNHTGTMVEQSDDDINKVSITILPMEYEDAQSRVSTDASASFTWEANDTVGIFPTAGGQVEYIISEEDAGKKTVSFDGGGWSLKSNHQYYAYLPFNFYNRNRQAIPFSYLGQEQDGNQKDPRSHISNYLFFSCPPAKSSGNSLTFNFSHMGAVLNVYLTLPVATTYTAMTIFTDAKVLPIKKTFNIETTQIDDSGVTIDETVTEYSDRLTLNLKNVTTSKENEEVLLCMAFPSVSADGHALKVVVYDKYGFTYTGNLLRKDNGNQVEAKFGRSKVQNRKASPVFTENFNFGVANWESGNSFESTLK